MFRQIIQLSRPVSQVLIVLFITMMSQFILALATYNLPDTVEFNYLRLILSHLLLFIMPALVLLRGRGEHPESAWRLKPSKDIGMWGVALLSLPLLLSFNYWLEEVIINWENPWGWWENMREMASVGSFIIEMIEGSTLTATLAFLSVCVLAPLSEEIFFRGTIQRILSMAIPPTLSIVVTSFIFMRLHANVDEYPAIFISSLLLGFIYHRTQSLWTTIVAHMVFNMTSFMLVLGWFDFEPQMIASIIMLVLAFGIVLISPKLSPTQAPRVRIEPPSDKSE